MNQQISLWELQILLEEMCITLADWKVMGFVHQMLVSIKHHQNIGVFNGFKATIWDDMNMEYNIRISDSFIIQNRGV